MTPILLLLCWRGNATKKKKIQQFTQLHLERACGVGLCRLRTYVFWPEMSSLKKEDSIFPIRRHAAPSAFHRIAHTFSLLNKLTSRLKKKEEEEECPCPLSLYFCPPAFLPFRIPHLFVAVSPPLNLPLINKQLFLAVYPLGWWRGIFRASFNSNANESKSERENKKKIQNRGRPRDRDRGR